MLNSRGHEKIFNTRCHHVALIIAELWLSSEPPCIMLLSSEQHCGSPQSSPSISETKKTVLFHLPCPAIGSNKNSPQA